MDELDVKEKDTLKYDKVEIRQKDIPELVDSETKDSRMEEPRRYVGLFCLCAMVGQRMIPWLHGVKDKFVVVCPKCSVNTATCIS